MIVPDAPAPLPESFDSQWVWEAEVPPSAAAARDDRCEPKARRKSVRKECDPPALKPLLEGLIFASPVPLTIERLGELLRGAAIDEIRTTVAELNRQYDQQGRPYGIELSDEGLRFLLWPNYQHVLEQVYGGVKETRLNAASIEALAIVAYRQPAAKILVDSLRGQDSGNLLRHLVRKGLLTLHTAETADGDDHFATTARFLELFELKSLEDLPRAEELPRI